MSYTHPQHGSGEDARKRRKEAGKILRNRRLELEKTQREVAKEVGIEYYTMVSQIETGTVRLPPDMMEDYARCLQMDPSDLTKKMMYYYDPVTWKLLFGPKKT